MVGVAGRSKGCVTCRKRKKGCDLKRPACTQCTSRNIVCGGYNEDRNWVTSKYQAHGQVLDLAVLKAPQCVKHPSLEQTAFGMKAMEVVFNQFPGAMDVHGAPQPILQFLSLLTSLSVKEEALRRTISAVGLVMLGKESKDENLLYNGMRAYRQALQKLVVTLQTPGRPAIEASLATIRLMGVYEILHGADEKVGLSQQAQNWLSHAQGELSLIVAQGPEAFVEETSHLMFTLARYNAVFLGVRARKAVVFDEEEWKTIPWKGRFKPPSETIVDILLGLPGILEDLDRLDATAVEDELYEKMQLEVVAKCWLAHFELETWFAMNANEVFRPNIDAPIPIDFPSLAIASTSLRYWMAATLTYQSLERVTGGVSYDGCSAYASHPIGRPFARLIVRSVPWFFKNINGLMGSLYVAYPLGIALIYLRQTPIPDHDYMGLVFSGWDAPDWPSSVKSFLRSLASAINMPTRLVLGSSQPPMISQLEPIYDVDGNTLGGHFPRPSRFYPELGPAVEEDGRGSSRELQPPDHEEAVTACASFPVQVIEKVTI